MDTRDSLTPAASAALPASCLFGLARRVFEAAALSSILIVLSLSGRAQAAEPWPFVPLPPKADVQWVAQSMRVNGVPTRVMQFQSRASRAEVADFYRAYWTGGYLHKASVHAMGQEATVVGQKHGPYLMTLKVEDAAGGTSTGLISVAQVIGSRVDRDPGELPLMGGAHVISVVESDDPGKHSREIVVLTPQPPSSAAQFYQASLTNAHWLEIQRSEGPRKAGGPDGSFAVFARDGSEMQLSIVATPKGRGSVLVANLVTKDTGSLAY
jgi:hypothetical protein